MEPPTGTHEIPTTNHFDFNRLSASDRRILLRLRDSDAPATVPETLIDLHLAQNGSDRPHLTQLGWDVAEWIALNAAQTHQADR